MGWLIWLIVVAIRAFVWTVGLMIVFCWWLANGVIRSIARMLGHPTVQQPLAEMVARLGQRIDAWATRKPRTATAVEITVRIIGASVIAAGAAWFFWELSFADKSGPSDFEQEEARAGAIENKLRSCDSKYHPPNPEGYIYGWLYAEPGLSCVTAAEVVIAATEAREQSLLPGDVTAAGNTWHCESTETATYLRCGPRPGEVTIQIRFYD